MKDDWQGFVIAVATFVVGTIVVALIHYFWKKGKEKIEKNLIYDWLKNNTGENSLKGYTFCTTRTISSNVNLSADRVADYVLLIREFSQAQVKKMTCGACVKTNHNCHPGLAPGPRPVGIH